MRSVKKFMKQILPGSVIFLSAALFYDSEAVASARVEDSGILSEHARLRALFNTKALAVRAELDSHRGAAKYEVRDSYLRQQFESLQNLHKVITELPVYSALADALTMMVPGRELTEFQQSILDAQYEQRLGEARAKDEINYRERQEMNRRAIAEKRAELEEYERTNTERDAQIALELEALEAALKKNDILFVSAHNLTIDSSLSEVEQIRVERERQIQIENSRERRYALEKEISIKREEQSRGKTLQEDLDWLLASASSIKVYDSTRWMHKQMARPFEDQPLALFTMVLSASGHGPAQLRLTDLGKFESYQEFLNAKISGALTPLMRSLGVTTVEELEAKTNAWLVNLYNYDLSDAQMRKEVSAKQLYKLNLFYNEAKSDEYKALVPTLLQENMLATLELSVIQKAKQLWDILTESLKRNGRTT